MHIRPLTVGASVDGFLGVMFNLDKKNHNGVLIFRLIHVRVRE
ncbi:protein of unknown function [Denitratisoma oestradiolicum]|uniref:Uncharacterized protein n=1 Tax=Denitratisoma oestradiolicum TaxID=311182 RepID=A0A6S6XTW1_9PROT|nr:protein of unknown function [Denitratisoma oestradiolicum]